MIHQYSVLKVIKLKCVGMCGQLTLVMQDMDFLQLITCVYLLLMSNSDKISDNFVI